MRQTLQLPPGFSSGACHIEIRTGILSDDTLGEWLGDNSRAVAVITDSNVAPLYGEAIVSAIGKKGFRVRLFVFSSGEQNKQRSTVGWLQDQILEWGMDRDGVVVAVGGGVVTDVAGFVAATLFRGVDLVMVPTSLLAMVDASIGAKTGVNTAQGKNLIGTFWQPKTVVIDPQVLRTLPHKGVREGISEMLKHGLIADVEYFERLALEVEPILALETVVIENAIATSCRIKAGVVVEDGREQSGKRRILNFGHTVGHALEKVTRYALSHGDAVAIGIQVEARLSVEMGLLSEKEYKRIIEVLKQYELPIKVPEEVSLQQVIEAMQHDKKGKRGAPRFVLLESIGACSPFNGEYCTEVDQEALKDVLNSKVF